MSGCCGQSDKLNIDILNIAQQDCDPDVHCVPSTDGKPTDEPPENKKDIIRRDPCTKKVWLYTCDGGWKEIEFSLCSLEELDSSVINNICETLRIPAFYDSNGCCVQGSFSLQDLADIIEKCLCPPENGVITLEEGVDSDDWVHVSDDECNVTRKKLAFNYEPPCPPDNGVITLEEGINSDDWVHVSDDACNVTRKKLAFNTVDCCPQNFLINSAVGGGGVCLVTPVIDPTYDLTTASNNNVPPESGSSVGPLVMTYNNVTTETHLVKALLHYDNTSYFSELVGGGMVSIHLKRSDVPFSMGTLNGADYAIAKFDVHRLDSRYEVPFGWDINNASQDPFGRAGIADAGTIEAWAEVPAGTSITWESHMFAHFYNPTDIVGAKFIAHGRIEGALHVSEVVI